MNRLDMLRGTPQVKAFLDELRGIDYSQQNSIEDIIVPKHSQEKLVETDALEIQNVSSRDISIRVNTIQSAKVLLHPLDKIIGVNAIKRIYVYDSLTAGATSDISLKYFHTAIKEEYPNTIEIPMPECQGTYPCFFNDRQVNIITTTTKSFIIEGRNPKIHIYGSMDTTILNSFDDVIAIRVVARLQTAGLGGILYLYEAELKGSQTIDLYMPFDIDFDDLELQFYKSPDSTMNLGYQIIYEKIHL